MRLYGYQLVCRTMKIEHMDIVNEKYNNNDNNDKKKTQYPINMQKMIENDERPNTAR